MARIPYVDPATASEEVRETFKRLPVQLNIFRMMAHAETSFRPLISLGTSILAKQQLAPKLRELVILLVAHDSPAPYEWVQHVPIAQATGASADDIAALERGDIEAPCFDQRERAVLRFAREVVRDVGASEATFEDARRHLTPREVVEVIITAGYYGMLARLMQTTAIDIDGPVGTKITDSLR